MAQLNEAIRNIKLNEHSGDKELFLDAAEWMEQLLNWTEVIMKSSDERKINIIISALRTKARNA